jgi:salicylate hydroxylase
MSARKPLRIAITGGGIAGLCLARGLLNLSQQHKPQPIEITVYEQVHSHRDKGGALALHKNAIGAMDLIDPALKEAYMRVANSMLEDDEKEMATHVILAESLPDRQDVRGEVIARLGRAKGRKTVSRVDLISGYMKLLPEGAVKMGKHLSFLTETPSGEITLHFSDGTTAEADCLIGSDGIHSVIRSHLLSATHPTLIHPVNHNLWYRVGVRLPTEQLQKSIGPEFQGYVPILCGRMGSFVTLPIQFGRFVNVGMIRKARNKEEIGWVPSDEELQDYHPDVRVMAKVSPACFFRPPFWTRHQRNGTEHLASFDSQCPSPNRSKRPTD